MILSAERLTSRSVSGSCEWIDRRPSTKKAPTSIGRVALVGSGAEPILQGVDTTLPTRSRASLQNTLPLQPTLVASGHRSGEVVGTTPFHDGECASTKRRRLMSHRHQAPLPMMRAVIREPPRFWKHRESPRCGSYQAAFGHPVPV